MRVCVIGAGASGLAVAKHLLEEGIEADLLEKRDNIGGLWYVAEGVPSLALNTTATSSKTFLQFSDFPMGRQAAAFPHSSEYLSYLKRYAQKHDLIRRIKFERDVVSVRKQGTKWQVVAQHQGREESSTYDAVAICSGQHHIPLCPEIPGAKDFAGQLIHSAYLKDVESLRGKRVIVVGAGESAADYAHDLVGVASELSLALRRGIAITRHLGLRGLPADLDSTRAKAWLPRPFLHDYNVDCRLDDRYSAFKTMYTLLGLPFLSAMLPVAPDKAMPFLRNLLHRETWQALFKPAKRHGPASGVELSRACAALCEATPESPAEVEEKATKLKYLFDWYSGSMHNSQPFTKQYDFLRDIAQKKLRVVPSIARFSGGLGVDLEDGSSLEADAVLLCTGFSSRMPFLEAPDVDGRDLYKNVFMPGDRTLGFIGLIRPNVGSLPAVAELQARWFAAVLAGRVTLPDAEQMSKEIALDRQRYTEARPHHVKRVTSLVDYHAYMEELAGFLGCRPNLLGLLGRPKQLFTFIFGPFGCFQYRLDGHGANTQAVQDAVEQVPPVPVERVLQHAILYCVMKPGFALLDKAGLKQFQPKC